MRYCVLGRNEDGLRTMMVGQLIRTRRLKKGYSQEQFAEVFGTSQRQVTRWEQYTTELPRMATRDRIGAVLNIAPEEWLLAAAEATRRATEQPPEMQAGSQVGESPVWYVAMPDEELMRRTGLTPAPPQAARAFEEIEYGMGARPIPQDIDDTIPRAQRSRRRPHVWMFRVTGTCLVPEINPGEIVYVNRDLGLAHGCYVAASLRGETAVVKRYVLRNGQAWLESNDDWEQIVDETVRIFGRVEGAQRSFL